MRSFIKSMLVPCFTVVFAALALQACSGDQNTGGGGCTPGATQVCTCNGTDTGVQACSADGRSFGACNCGSGAGGNGSGSSSSSASSSGTAGAGGGGNCHLGTGVSPTCGNGMVDDAAEECDDGNCIANDECNNNCKNPYCGDGVVQAGEMCDGDEMCPSDCGVMMSSSSSSSSGMVDPCAGKLVFAGLAAASKGAFSFGGDTGLDAATKACQALGGFGMCDYDQWKQLEGDPMKYKTDLDKLGMTIANGTCQKVWLQRTTDVGAMKAGPGGRCNNWNYDTDHDADGEFVDICNNAGTITFTYTLDPDTTFIMTGMNGPYQNPGMPCNQMRPIPCCFQKCVSP